MQVYYVLQEEEVSEDTTSGSDADEYDKPATLSAAHLNAILFSCENIAHSAATDPHTFTAGNTFTYYCR